MNPWVVLGNAEIPNGGGTLKLSQREDEFSIRLSGVRGELMNSRVHNSEEALAEIGCAHLKSQDESHVLVGGLGMGFTLAAALKAVSKTSTVTVAELIPEVVEWNRGPLGECAGRPLDDARTQIRVGDVAELFGNHQKEAYDVVLLDVDNGPEGLTHTGNHGLYSLDGLRAIHKTLSASGVLAVWSAYADQTFVGRLKKAGYNAQMRTVRARAGKGSRHTIYIASKLK